MGSDKEFEITSEWSLFTDAGVCIQARNLVHFFCGQLEVENVDILLNMRSRATAWDRDGSSGHGPIKHHLCLRLTILGADCIELGIVP